jgi:predicted phage terminase large subunit-like protein
VREFYEEDRPDILLIENKAAGMQLIQEFRSMGLPVESFTGSSRGKSTMVRGIGTNDKIARANSVVDIFASGYVWAPERRFAEMVIEQMAEFPNSDEDDLLDSAVQAMIRFRMGGIVRTANDEVEDDEPRTYRRKRMY